MCVICLMIDKDKFTPKEFVMAWGEISPQDDHKDEIIEKLFDLKDDEFVKEVFDEVQKLGDNEWR